MTLRQFKTTEELQALYDKEVAGGHEDRPENNYPANVLRAAIAGPFPATTLEVYGYPASDAQYLFFVEYSDVMMCCIHIRPPLTGHDFDLLDKAAPIFLATVKDTFTKLGAMELFGDEQSCDVVEKHLNTVAGETYKAIRSTECGVFYMTSKQREALLATQLVIPPGVTIERLNVDRDGDALAKQWQFGLDPEATKRTLRDLPATCARTEDGKNTVGWIMTAQVGHLANLWVQPEYRYRGVGKALELAIAQELARTGTTVYKYVEADNRAVYEQALVSPYWTLWTEGDDEKPHHIHFRELWKE